MGQSPYVQNGANVYWKVVLKGHKEGYRHQTFTVKLHEMLIYRFHIFMHIRKSKSNEVVQFAAQTNQQNESRLIYRGGRLRDWSCFLYLPFH